MKCFKCVNMGVRNNTENNNSVTFNYTHETAIAIVVTPPRGWQFKFCGLGSERLEPSFGSFSVGRQGNLGQSGERTGRGRGGEARRRGRGRDPASSSGPTSESRTSRARISRKRKNFPEILENINGFSSAKGAKRCVKNHSFLLTHIFNGFFSCECFKISFLSN